MDSVFFLDEEDRARFLRTIVQTFSCTYICLWSYFSYPSNCVLAIDGWCNYENKQPSSSSGSLAHSLFNDYRHSLYTVDDIDCVPGFAFKEGISYLELKELELLGRVSNETQLQFYKEAKIKTAVFMGSKSGEIELGMSTLNHVQLVFLMQTDMEMEIRIWLQSQFRELPRVSDQNWPLSSSSSLRSLSVDSQEYSSLLFNMPGTSYMPEFLKEELIGQAIRPISTAVMPPQQDLQVYNWLHNIQFRTRESNGTAMTRAMLTALSSSSSSSSSSSYLRQGNSAFKIYTSALAPRVQMKPNLRRQNILKGAMAFLESMNLMRIHEQMRGTRRTFKQVHHAISERKRREKINESFLALTSLLPPGSKKDKISVLSTIRAYLSALKAQVFQLSEKNRLLEARLLSAKEASEEVSGSSNGGVLNIQVRTSESTSEEREVDMRITVREDGNMMDLVIAIPEFLKQMRDISLLYMEASTQLQQSSSFNRLFLRLKIMGSEWDESAFREAMTRFIADLAQ
ncbi:hypothetical protein HHK36_014309 [Tetracentron sinense]|uniref:BHLH domain-containing protein n=1 Tax=Tetracentron sinense TaxID=13715 RepID=A0A834Z8I4_TETSI|nr:hypothetical protein HHK36_014309 [Tetracentron sinense]